MKFDILFEIEVPRPWDRGKEARIFHECIEQAVFAERMGFDTIWFVEHHFLAEFAHSSAPDAMIGAIAARTSRIRLGFGVTLLPGAVNHPIRVAERMATADIVSNGRLEVGTGRSSSPYQLRSFGTDLATTREQWEESLRLLPELWTREKFAYQGRHWHWEDEITVLPRPVQEPHPPLWVASTQPSTCQMAGEKGIGLLLPALATPEALAEQVRAYKNAVRAPIDQIGAFRNAQCALFSPTFCHEDDATARAIGGPAAMWYLKTVGEIYKDDWKGQSLDEVPDSYRWHAERTRQSGVGGGTVGGNWAERLVPTPSHDGYIDSGAFCIGDPARCIDTVGRYRDVGADRLVSVMQLGDIRHEDLMHNIEMFGNHVIPAFR